jgi:hypothetical protein
MWDSRRHKLGSWFLAAAGFGILAVTIDSLWTHFVINGTTASEPARINHLIHEDGSEIPVFGPSTAHDDFVPEILGNDVFNYGMDGSSLDVVDALLQIECKKHKTTPIVLSLSEEAGRSVGAPSKFPLFVGQPEIRQMLERLGLMEWRYRVPALRYFGFYDWYLKDYLIEHLLSSRRPVGGYTAQLEQPFDRRTLDAAIKLRLEAGFGFSSLPDQTRLLFDAINSTPHRTFVIVFPPLHSSCFSKFKDPEGFARYVSQLQSFKNVVVLDWSRMELPDECFRDTLHLNQKGAIEFSRRFGDRLQKIRRAINS